MRVFRIGFYVSITLYIALALLFFFYQSAIYFPAPKTWTRATPSDVGLEWEDLKLPVAEGGQIHAWWAPQKDSRAKSAIFFHGNSGVLDGLVLSQMVALHDLGLNVLYVDYRGYGTSSVMEPREATVLQDADAALGYLTNVRGIGIGEIYFIGGSLGTGPAVYLAAKYAGAAGAILENPLTSIDDVARKSPWLRMFPVGLLLRTHFDNSARMPFVRCPVFIAGGEEDTSTPPWMARQLYQRAHEPKQLLLIANAGHFDLIQTGGTDLQHALQQFLYLSGKVKR
jgi:fermentation-respiration switch protein FrsA (DUF1100 family)